jgi:hypothetical protein
VEMRALLEACVDSSSDVGLRFPLWVCDVEALVPLQSPDDVGGRFPSALTGEAVTASSYDI